MLSRRTPSTNCDRAQGSDEHLYGAGKRARREGLAEDGRVTIVYTRFWSTPRWTFVTEGRNNFGDVLASAIRETFEEAKQIIEDDLRAQRFIV